MFTIILSNMRHEDTMILTFIGLLFFVFVLVPRCVMERQLSQFSVFSVANREKLAEFTDAPFTVHNVSDFTDIAGQ